MSKGCWAAAARRTWERNCIESMARPSSLAEPGGKTALYAYDPAGRRVSMEAYGKGIFTYAYDAAGRQTQVLTPQLQSTSIGYGAVGRVTARQFASGAMTTQTYDAAGNVLGITNDSPASLVSRFAYSYDKANHRLTRPRTTGRSRPGRTTGRTSCSTRTAAAGRLARAST